jgi:hypothetical protein
MVQLGHGLNRYDFITAMKLKNELAKLCDYSDEIEQPSAI